MNIIVFASRISSDKEKLNEGMFCLEQGSAVARVHEASNQPYVSQLKKEKESDKALPCRTLATKPS